MALVSPPLPSLEDEQPSFGFLDCTNNHLYSVPESCTYPLKTQTPKGAGDHHNNQLALHQNPASSTFLETILTRSKHICIGFHHPFFGPNLPTGASWAFPIYDTIYFYLSQCK